VEKRAEQFKPVRDWNECSEEFGYKGWIEKQREVRNNEFAPPAFYYTDAEKSKRRR